MSEEGQIKLAHDEYVEANNVNVNELPNELVAKFEAIDKMFDAYDADENDNPEAEAAIVKASADLKNEIEAWHAAKNAAPIIEPIVTPVAAAEPIVAPIVPPVAAAEEPEEDNDWSYTKFLK